MKTKLSVNINKIAKDVDLEKQKIVLLVLQHVQNQRNVYVDKQEEMH